MKRRRLEAPPVLATALVALSAGKRDRSFLLGDLEEEFRSLARSRGRRAARSWYWSQAVRSTGTLLVARIIAKPAVRSAGATVMGAMTAAVSAMLFGVVLGQLLGSSAGLPLPVVTVGVTAVALLSSTLAGCVSRWIAGRCDRWAHFLIAFVVVAPEVTYLARLGPDSIPLEILPLALAILGACWGLSLSGRLWSLAQSPPGETR